MPARNTFSRAVTAERIGLLACAVWFVNRRIIANSLIVSAVGENSDTRHDRRTFGRGRRVDARTVYRPREHRGDCRGRFLPDSSA